MHLVKQRHHHYQLYIGLVASSSLAIGCSGMDNLSETATVDRVPLVDRRSMLEVPVNSGLLILP